MKYKVHIDPFAVADKAPIVVEVEADTVEEAYEKAERMSDSWVQHGDIYYEAHYAEEIK